MAQPIISTTNLARTFGKTKALDGVSISIDEGMIYGLLGPNGAGKTTLVRILATLIPPTSGTATVAGLDVVRHSAKVRKIIGLAGQFAAVDDFLTGRETLEMVGRFYHLSNQEAKKRAAVLLERLSLADAANRTAKTYSGGMRKRLDIGASLIGEPKIIFLDEPTTGLDPRTRAEVWDIVRDLVKRGSTILLTTQYLEEADALAQYISVVDHGKIVAQGTSSELKNSLGQDLVEVAVEKDLQSQVQNILSTVAGQPATIDEITGHIRITAKEGSATLLAVANALKAQQITVHDIALHRPTLDDVFLAVTGKPTVKEQTKQ
ncbi:MAG: ATP-binding cassette domain-containing protein [Candidatus Kerfeldbacteria bacterium]|nr:ATP-binding cassette domain-containing protein [Candidatus Kerfeldbacteria bacterium]